MKYKEIRSDIVTHILKDTGTIMSCSSMHCVIAFSSTADISEKSSMIKSVMKSIYNIDYEVIPYIRIPRADAKVPGLFRKYMVVNLNNPAKHTGCEYYVLDLYCDKYAVPALRAYVEACKEEKPELAKDLQELIERVDVWQRLDQDSAE
jgi:hypothetical protein